MRNRGILLILFCCTAFVSWSQDSTVHEKEGFFSTIRQKIKPSTAKQSLLQDSLRHALTTDSLTLSTDSLKRSKGSYSDVYQKGDSLPRLGESQNSVTSYADTLSRRINKPVHTVRNFTDTLIQKPESFFQRKMDSVKQQINKPIDKANSKLSDIAKPAEEKAAVVNERIETKTNKLQTNLQQGFDKATDGNVKAPLKDANGAAIKLPDRPENIKGAGNVTTPGLPVSGTNLPGVSLPNEALKISGTDLSVEQIKQKVSVEIPDADKLKNVKSETGQLDSKLAEGQRYEEELQGLKRLDSTSVQSTAKRIEDKVANIDELKGVEEQKALLTKEQLDYKAMMQRYQDKKLLKDEITRKSRNVVNGKIDKLTPAFKEAQEKIGKAKKLNPDVEKYKDGRLKRVNDLKERPEYERLVPGVTLQVYNRDVFTIDWGLQVGYKLAHRILVGAGGVYRVQVSEKYATWIKSSGLYGYRAYGDFNLVKSFYAHGEFESLYTKTYFNSRTNQEVGAHYAYNGYFGIGKRYDITKKIRGSVIVLYRAEFRGNLPAMSKINLRVGFDLNTKKRTKLPVRIKLH